MPTGNGFIVEGECLICHDTRDVRIDGRSLSKELAERFRDEINHLEPVSVLPRLRLTVEAME